MASGVAATGYPEAQIALVPNISDVARFRGPKVRAENFLAEHPSLQGRQLVVYAGTLGRLNGVEYLAEIAKEMQALNPQVSFLVFGDGGCREIVQQSAQQLGVLNNNFFMLGPIPKNKIPDVFAAASVCVSLFVNIPEMWKNSANKFFDTLAAGKPILINYEGWQLDLINEYNIGIGVPAEDPLDAAIKLNELLSSCKSLQKAGENSRAMGEENFHVDELSSRALSVLKSAVKTYA
jgi:glycosyltransferase involved in cell wall biosynthesis